MIHWLWTIPAFAIGIAAGGFVMALAAAAGRSKK